MTITHITEIAIGLFILRLITVFYIVRVIRRQIELFRLHIDTGLVRFRKTMLTLSIVFLLGNIMPIIIDFYYGFVDPVRKTDILLVLYAVSNAVMSLAASIIPCRGS